MDKLSVDADAALEGVEDDSIVLISGFGPPGQPDLLIDALVRRRLRGLTIVNNNANAGGEAITQLFQSGAVRKVVCSFPKSPDPRGFEEKYRAGEIELELVPQGTLAERIRSAGAGVEGFYTRTAVGTELQAGKPVMFFDGVEHVLERAIHADVALVRARAADVWGNLLYTKTARNFGPIMATAARLTVAQVDTVVDGVIDPETVVTPGIFVDRIVRASVGAAAVEVSE